MLRPGVPLDYPSIRITGVGRDSVIDLKTLRISAPAFRKEISVAGGVLADVKAFPISAS